MREACNLRGVCSVPLLYSLSTHDCTARHDYNTIIKFDNDKTVVCLITDNDETAYREEVGDLTGMGPEILKRFYSCTIESILTGCITAWYGNCSASDHKAL